MVNSKSQSMNSATHLFGENNPAGTFTRNRMSGAVS